MEKISPRTKLILVGVGVGIVIVLAIGAIVFVFHHKSSTPAPVSVINNETSTVPSTTPAGASLSSTGKDLVVSADVTTTSTPIASAPTITINLLTPIANNVWQIGQPNPIAWSTAANITGEIDLVNATTKQFIGVILSNTGANQTSYIWDARSIYLGRYSADKKDVVPGTYSIRIHFDGNGLGDLVSGPITIGN